MKNKLLITAAFIFAFAVILHHYEKPVMAQVRAALVQNIDEPGRAPFSIQVGCDGNSNSNACFGTSSTAVPANKRFVVQNVNGALSIFGSGTFVTGTVTADVINGANLNIDPHFTANAFGYSSYVINMAAVAYFEAGQTPSLEIISSATSAAPSGTVTLSGYLIDLTQ
jgi:hypothetical protein